MSCSPEDYTTAKGPLGELLYIEGLTKAEIEQLMEKCAVTLVVASEDQVVEMAYYLARKMDHRGPHTYGIFVFVEGDWMPLGQWVVGRVKDATSANLEVPRDKVVRLAIMHSRYATTGGINLGNAQPLIGGNPKMVVQDDDEAQTRSFRSETDAAIVQEVFKEDSTEVFLAHNGNFPLAPEMWFKLGLTSYFDETKSDSWHFCLALYEAPFDNIEDKLKFVLGQIPGSASLVGQYNGISFAFRDGNRPLHISSWQENGKSCHAVVSEDSALKGFAQSFGLGEISTREVKPGELILIENGEVQYIDLSGTRRGLLCALEFVYFSRGDSSVMGVEINKFRLAWGVMLSQLHPFATQIKDQKLNKDDLVIVSSFNGGNKYAEGFAKGLGVEVKSLFLRNQSEGHNATKQETRSFMGTPDQRKEIAKAKFPIDLDILKTYKNKRIVIVDDSLVRGTVSKAITENIREAVAAIRNQEDWSDFDIAGIDFVSGSPMYLNQCLLGVNLVQSELIFQQIIDKEGRIPKYDEMVELIAQELGYNSVYFPPFNNWAKVMADLMNLPDGPIGREVCMRCMQATPKQDPVTLPYQGNENNNPVMRLYTAAEVAALVVMSSAGYPTSMGGPNDPLVVHEESIRVPT